MSAASENTLIGQRFGPYRIDSLLGSGGMGDVFRGVHEKLGRPVAIKTLKSDIGVSESTLGRFINEARAVNAIRHENIVEVTDFAPDGFKPHYMVMELLEGSTLTGAIRSAGRMAPERAVRIAAQIASAIGAAHALDIVHRDLKPDNVFLIRRAGSTDYVKILDFGIARLRRAPGDITATKSTALIGTPAYMSPEQAEGVRATYAADIYALGVIVFQMITGKLPFQATSVLEMMYAHLKLKPPKMSDISPDVPRSVTDVIASALSKKPADRPPSMLEFGRALVRAVDLDPRDFELSEPKTGGKRPQATRPKAEESAILNESTMAALSNAPDSRAESMWGGATVDSTQERSTASSVDDDRSDDASAGQPTSNLRRGLDVTRSEFGQAQAPALAPTPPARSRPLSETEKAELGGLDTVAPTGDEERADASLERIPDIGDTGAGMQSTVDPDITERRMKVVAIPTPAPIEAAVPATYVHQRRLVLGGAILLVGVAVAVGLALTRSGEPKETNSAAVERPSDDPTATTPQPDPGRSAGDQRELRELRAQLNALTAEHQVPATPASCQSDDVPLLRRLVDAAGKLAEGQPGENRTRDVLALEVLNKPVESAEYWYWLAKARLYTGAADAEVMDAATRAVESCDAYAGAHMLVGTALFRQYKAVEAEPHLLRALQLEPEFENARFNLALVKMGKNEAAEAIGLLSRVIEKMPTMYNARLARAQSYIMNEQFEKALVDLLVLTEKQPTSANAFFLQGLAQERLGRNAESRKSMCRAAELGEAKAAEFCSE